MAAAKNRAGEMMDHRLTLRLSENDFERLSYWAKRAGEPSINQFIPDLLDLWVDIQNGNYQIPTLEQKRLNQLVDVIKGLSIDIKNLQETTSTGFTTLTQMTKGDNYLFDENEDGSY